MRPLCGTGGRKGVANGAMRPGGWAPPRSHPLGEWQYQSDQVGLPGDVLLLINLMQVVIGGGFRAARRRGDLVHGLALRQPDRGLALRRSESQGLRHHA